MKLFASVLFTMIAMSLASNPTVAAPKGNAQACKAKATEAVGGDTYRQGKRYTAIYRACMNGG